MQLGFVLHSPLTKFAT